MPADLRIAFVSPAWPASLVQNGIATYVDYMRQGLHALGLPSGVIAYEVGPGADPLVVRTGSRERSWSRRLGAGLRRRLAPASAVRVATTHAVGDGVRDLRQRWPFQVLEMEESFGIAAMVRRRCPVPLVVRLHGPWFLTGAASGVPDDASFRTRIAHERLGIVHAAAVSAPSNALLRAVREHYGEALPHAHVVPNPGPPLPPQPMWQPRRDRRHLLHVGRFERLKGSDVVVAAFARIAAAHPDLELLLAGPDRGMLVDGRLLPVAQYLASLALPGDIAARIRFLDAVPPAEVAALRRSCAVAIVASRYENFPMTVLEAMADGVPIVASAAGGIPEILRDGVTGRLVAPGDPAALAEALTTLLAQPATAAQLGAAAREHYRITFTPEVVARRMLALYEQVAAATPAR